MIKSINLKNFQAHKDTYLEFSPGVNSIIGTSYKGKSSIFRALDFNIRNTTNDTAYISHWCFDKEGRIIDNSEVTIEIDDHIIKRVKGKDNYYNVDEAKTNEEGFGRLIPEHISDIYRMDEINIQKQRDSFFLFNLSRGKVAEVFNKIVNLEIIDTTISNIKSKLREIKNDEKAINNKVNEYADEIEKYNFINKIEKEIEQLQELDSTICNLKKENEDLKQLTEKIKFYQVQLDTINSVVQTEQEIDYLCSLVAERSIIQNATQSISDIVVKIQQIDTVLNLLKIPDNSEINELIDVVINRNKIEIENKELKTILEKYNTVTNFIQNIKIPSDKMIEIIVDLLNKKIGIETENKELQTIVNNCKDLEIRIINGETYIKEAEKEFNDLLESVGICPLCGNKINKEQN